MANARAAKAPSPERARLALDIFTEHTERLQALAIAIEARLGHDCNDGKSPADGAPVTTWRLAQVLTELLGTKDIERYLRLALGLKMGSPR